jgi:NAD(P)-dependent dehydrogenase (short-subunit alcohol dehydrogenase family)
VTVAEGRIVFITGVSSGIGEGLAREHLARGDRVFATARRTPAQDLLDEEGFRFSAGDLTDEEQVAAIVDELLRLESRVDVAWLNAGSLGGIGDMRDQQLSDMRATMEINVWANKSVLDELFALQVPVHQVITISSGAAVNGNRGWNGYSISKAALNMLTQLYAAECPETHFTAFAPGLVDTAMQDQLCGMEPDPKFASLATLKAARGTERMPKPDEAARRLIARLDDLRTGHESGSFVDIRKMDA